MAVALSRRAVCGDTEETLKFVSRSYAESFATLLSLHTKNPKLLRYVLNPHRTLKHQHWRIENLMTSRLSIHSYIPYV